MCFVFWLNVHTNIVDEKQAAYLENVAKSDVINFYKKYVIVDAPNRAKLAVYVLGKNLNDCKFKFKFRYFYFQNLELFNLYVIKIFCYFVLFDNLSNKNKKKIMF